MVPKDVDAVVSGACPIVGSFGRKDLTLRGAAAKLDSALRAAGVAHDVKEYADAGHGSRTTTERPATGFRSWRG